MSDRNPETACGAQSQNDEGGAVVRALDVVKSYRKGRDRVEVLNGLSLDVERGTFLAIMGPSGSGKTTFLNLLTGLDRPDSGTIEVGGQSVEQMSRGLLGRWRARHVGLVFQVPRLLPMLTAQRNVELPLALTDLSRRQRQQHVSAALELIGLADRAKHYPKELSGGQEQRVGIARAIVTDPSLLVCDEPTGDLDRKTGDDVLHLLKALTLEHSKTVIMVTHDQHASTFADRTLHLHDGVLNLEPAAEEEGQ